MKALVRITSMILITAIIAAGCNSGSRPDEDGSLYVGTASGADYQTVSGALQSPRFRSGATIILTDAVHTEYSIEISDDVVILGRPRGGTIIQAHVLPDSEAGRIFTINEGARVELRDLVMRHGSPRECPMSGGAIYNEGELTIRDSVVTKNSASTAGGINNRGTLKIYDSEVSSNTADRRAGEKGSGGGIKSEKGLVVLVRTELIGNESIFRGGAIKLGCGSTLEATDCRFIDNRAAQTGGAIHTGGTAVIRDSIFRGNESQNAAGILNRGHLTVSGLRFRNNRTSISYGNGEIMLSEDGETITEDR